MANRVDTLNAARGALSGGRPEVAEKALRSLLSFHAADVDARYYLARSLAALGRLDEAVVEFSRLLAIRPDHPRAAVQLGIAYSNLGNHHAAQAVLEQAKAVDPHSAELHFARGLCQLGLEDFPAAAASFRSALARNLRIPDVYNNLGTALFQLGQLAEAVDSFRQAVKLAPRFAAAQRNLADSLLRIGDARAALEAFRDAAALEPTDPQVHTGLGEALHRLGRLPEALACYERVLAADPNRRSVRLNRGHALESLGSITEALECFRSVLEGQPQDRSALAGSASCAFRLCDWDLADSAVKQLIEIPDGIDDLHPFLRLALDIEPAALAASFARESQAIAARAPEVPVPAFSHGRLRIAYLSPDFRRHPVAYALAGVIRHHDRQIFETIGVSLTAPDDSDIAVELRSSFEKFLDCAAMSDADIVRALRAREIDIAVDLAGFTSGSRPAIFAARIAPVQVNYLGFPGSTGARYMDFIIADDVVAPAADARLYSERIVRLPRSYLPFDRDRSIAIAPARRRDYGLPDDAVVLCAFTNGYKISRAVFELWLSLLGAVPDSVLWLRSGPAAMQANLLSAATKHGVGADRLVFSPFVARMDEHLARLQLADLFLDTLPYGAHTTTAEALWAGLPVITCRGRTFAGRVGASLLSAAGLPDLITESLDEYHDRALRLAVSPGARAELRERVHARRKIAAAFDTVGYVRDLESALGRLCREH